MRVASRILAALLFGTLLTLLSGCGQKGDLYLPPKEDGTPPNPDAPGPKMQKSGSRAMDY